MFLFNTKCIRFTSIACVIDFFIILHERTVRHRYRYPINNLTLIYSEDWLWWLEHLIHELIQSGRVVGTGSWARTIGAIYYYNIINNIMNILCRQPPSLECKGYKKKFKLSMFLLIKGKRKKWKMIIYVHISLIKIVYCIISL